MVYMKYSWLVLIAVGFFLSMDCYATINIFRIPSTSYDSIYLNPASSELNKQLGKLFLAKNKLNPETFTLDNGLQFKILRNGVGAKPTLFDSISVNYIGRSLSGSIF